MRVPSGDQSGAKSWRPFVVTRYSDAPVGVLVKMSSSFWPGVSAENAIRVPLGDHEGRPTDRNVTGNVSFCAVPPAEGITNSALPAALAMYPSLRRLSRSAKSV